MIPVLGVPILNGPEKLQRMLESIDAPVGRLVVVDNGDVIPHNQDERMTIVRPGYNLGVAASWNLIMKVTPDAPWWCIVNHDIEFGAGDLQRLIGEMEKGGLVLLGGFTAFGIDRKVVSSVGFFDESFHPAYFEDNDYDYRCRLAGVDLRAIPSGMRHEVSSTIKSDEHLVGENQRTFEANKQYYLEKWGGLAYRETFQVPFNGTRAAYSAHIGPDIDRLAWQRWK